MTYQLYTETLTKITFTFVNLCDNYLKIMSAKYCSKLIIPLCHFFYLSISDINSLFCFSTFLWYTDKPKTDKPKTRQTQDRQTQDRQTQDTTNPRHDQPKTRQTQDTTDPRHDKPKTRHFSNKTRDTFQFCMYRYNKTELDLFKRRWKTKEFRSER